MTRDRQPDERRRAHLNRDAAAALRPRRSVRRDIGAEHVANPTHSHPVGRLRCAIGASSRACIAAGGLSILEVCAVAARDQRVGVSRVSTQCLANHDAGFRPVGEGFETVDACRDLAVTGQRRIRISKLVARAPDVDSRSVDRVDAVAIRARVGRSDRADVLRGRERLGEERRGKRKKEDEQR